MTFEELLLESARLNRSHIRIIHSLKELDDPDPSWRARTEKAKNHHDIALHSVATEIAIRFAASEKDRQTYMFKMMATAVGAALSYCEMPSSRAYSEMRSSLDNVREALRRED